MEESSSEFPLPLPQKEYRICLVGDVVKDVDVNDAAESLKIALKAEMIQVENSVEAIEATMVDKWLTMNCITFFVLKDFIGPVFKKIQEYEIKRDFDGGPMPRRNKEDDIKWILGPPAFKEIAKMPHDISLKKHPLYNYSMAGVVTCFTGIREKAELTELVNRIHFMGGCIRRNMDSKSTHLITRYSSGKKYMYAKTFRLAVLRPDWVDAAWEQRDNGIIAADDNFSQQYKLTLFEGLKICFFGFPDEEHQHMVDVLKTHGGISTELDDPQCSHVVMPNSVGLLSRPESFAKQPKTCVVSEANVEIEAESNLDELRIVDDSAIGAGVGVGAVALAINVEADNAMDVEIEEIDNMMADVQTLPIESIKEIPICTNDKEAKTSPDHLKMMKQDENECDEKINGNIDGIVLITEEDEKNFQHDISYISPILANEPINNENADDDMTASEKKSKFLRTGSIARKIRYSMNLVADNTPFLKGARQHRRNSHHIDTSISNESLINNISTILMPKEENDDHDHEITNKMYEESTKNNNNASSSSSKVTEGTITVTGTGTATPITRILRPRRFLGKKIDGNLWRGGECKMPTQASLFESTIYATQSTDNKRKRRPSKDSINEMYDDIKNRIDLNGDGEIATPKLRVLRPRRNLTISGLPSSLCKRNFFNETLEKISRKKRNGGDTHNESIKSARTYYRTENSDDQINMDNEDDDNDDDDDFAFNDTMDSCQLSMLSESTVSKKQKSFGFPGSASSSVKRTIRRSIHYVSEKTPLSKIFRNRRSSVTSIDEKDLTLSDTFSAIERPNKRYRMEVDDEEKEKEEMTGNVVPEFKTPKIPIKSLSHSSAMKAAAAAAANAATFKAAISVSTAAPTAAASSTELPSKVTDASSNNNAKPSSLLLSPSSSTSSSSSTCMKGTAQENMQVTQNLVGSLVATKFNSGTTTTSLLCSLKESGDSEMVVDEHSTQAKPNPTNLDTQILKSDWFWYTIQNGYADEKLYRFADYLDSIANTPDTDRRESLPISLNKRKRKRFSQRLQFEGSPLGLGKRRSSISDAVYSSFSDSFLDCTTSPDTSKIYVVEPETSVLESQTPAKKSLRFLHFMDFVNTESNYVGILDTIMTLFKIPLEELAEKDDALLNNTEINLIFGKFYSIHEVHQRTLERLRDLQNKWTENCLIGEIILELKDELIRSYPPYINSFETMKDTLSQCDKENPRFHAFLKINQTKPECGRQSLQDLMIRPVQRLPSISLLLNDILKHTGKTNPDHAKLEEALKTIKEVMTYINEDKRKTESRVAIFDIFNDIEGCPAHLVSSNRDFISKCEVIELSEELSGRGDALTFYLFSDTIEVCKKRSRGFNSAKSPGTTKMFKHVKLLPLNAIRFVIDITDSPRAFALLCGQDKEKFYSFSIEDEVDKIFYIKTLCKQMAEHACRASAEKSLLSRTSQELNVDISNINLSTLHKAFKLAARTRIKVGRAFSFNKTPSKLKRAVSTMMTSPFGSTNALTPASQLAQMRLASCTNIHEATDEDGSSRSDSPPIVMLEMPLSVQPERKHKASTLNSLGRL